MATITLTAGDFGGVVQGYVRVGSSSGLGSMGSISAEPIAGQTLDNLITSASGDSIAFVGNQDPNLLTEFTVGGNTWTVASGTYNAGTNTTDYPITTSGGEFVNGNAYTIVFDGAAAPNITTAAAQFNVEGHPLALTLTADKPITTWSIIGGADGADFEISGSTLRWAGNGTKDHSAPDDADTNNTYIVEIEAEDAESLTDTITITVTIEAVRTYNKVDKFGQYDNNIRGGADVWDDGLAGPILLADYFEASATPIGGTLSATLGDVTLAATGSGVSTINGSLSATLENVTVASTGQLRIAGTLTTTLGAVTSTASGALRIAGSTNATLGALASSATGQLRIASQLATTLGDVTASASGKLEIKGQAGLALGDVSASASAGLYIAGSLSVTFEGVTLDALAGDGNIEATLTATLDAVALQTGTISWRPVPVNAATWNTQSPSSGTWTLETPNNENWTTETPATGTWAPIAPAAGSWT